VSRPEAAPAMVVVPSQDARATPVRVAFVQAEERPAVVVEDEPTMMTFPHLLVRELVAFLSLSLVLVLVSLFFDAPLEEIADANRTPNPAKAPWYFLGLQEFLHYYPPIVSGVIMPGLLVVALAGIPYFDVNVERAPMWRTSPGPRLAALWGVVLALTAVLATTGAHPVWPLIGPLWAVALVMTVGGLSKRAGGLTAWLHTRSVPFWVFTWFVLSAVVLTVIGVFFRGPGWAFTLPWRDGIY
jgi:hypothetical protein